MSQAAIVEAADAVAEKVDILLDRAVDAVLGAPRAGSQRWHQDWRERESQSGHDALERRARVKITIAQLAGIDPRHEIERLRRMGLPTAGLAEHDAGARRRATPTRRGGGARAPKSGSGQLAIW